MEQPENKKEQKSKFKLYASTINNDFSTCSQFGYVDVGSYKIIKFLRNNPSEKEKLNLLTETIQKYEKLTAHLELLHEKVSVLIPSENGFVEETFDDEEELFGGRSWDQKYIRAQKGEGITKLKFDSGAHEHNAFFTYSIFSEEMKENLPSFVKKKIKKSGKPLEHIIHPQYPGWWNEKIDFEYDITDDLSKGIKEHYREQVTKYLGKAGSNPEEAFDLKWIFFKCTVQGSGTNHQNLEELKESYLRLFRDYNLEISEDN